MSCLHRLDLERERLKSEIIGSAIPALLDAWKDWGDELRALSEPRDEDRNLTVALVGEMGTGKSTLINALLDAALLPTSCTRACTSTVCEVTHAATDYSAEVEFLSRGQWEAEFAWLRQHPSTSDEEPVTEEGLNSSHRLQTVYRLEKGTNLRSLAGTFPREPEEIRAAFDQGKRTFVAPTAAEIGDAVAPYLSSEGGFWPIVRKVRIKGPFEVQNSGVTLADLPGVNDPNQAREQVALDYLDHSRFLWIVFSCRRLPPRRLFDVLAGKDLFRELFPGRRLA